MTRNTEMSQEIVADKPIATKMIVFAVGEQEYCVNILSVREIRGWEKATPVPFSSPFVKGVINLRGIVLPVLDMSVFLNIPREKNNLRQVVIVTEICGKILGVLVDRVSDILDISMDSVQEVSSEDGMRDVMSGLVALDDRMIGMLRLDSVLLAMGGPEGRAL